MAIELFAAVRLGRFRENLLFNNRKGAGQRAGENIESLLICEKNMQRLLSAGGPAGSSNLF